MDEGQSLSECRQCLAGNQIHSTLHQGPQARSVPHLQLLGVWFGAGSRDKHTTPTKPLGKKVMCIGQGEKFRNSVENLYFAEKTAHKIELGCANVFLLHYNSMVLYPALK